MCWPLTTTSHGPRTTDYGPRTTDYGLMDPVLETIDLKMVYHVGKVDVAALRGATLQVQPGEYVAIMGPSGCGKSTFLHIVGGMLKPTSGSVLIEGEDLTLMPEAERTDLRRRKIGFGFQRFNLFPTLTA